MHLWQTVWRVIRPPTGWEVRRLVAWICLVVGLVRVSPLAPLLVDWAPPPVYGWALVTTGLALLWTRLLRTHWAGRGAAVLGAMLLALLAADLAENPAATAVYGLLAYALIGEAGALDG